MGGCVGACGWKGSERWLFRGSYASLRDDDAYGNSQGKRQESGDGGCTGIQLRDRGRNWGEAEAGALVPPAGGSRAELCVYGVAVLRCVFEGPGGECENGRASRNGFGDTNGFKRLFVFEVELRSMGMRRRTFGSGNQFAA